MIFFCMFKFNFHLFPNRQMKNLICFLVFMISITAVSAQQATAVADTAHSEQHLQLLARNNSNSITLRWAPADVHTWRLANKNGYRLERLEMNEAAAAAGFELLGNFKPYTLQEWQDKANVRDSMVAGAAQTLFAVIPPPAGSSMVELKQRADDEHSLLVFALLCADLSVQASTGLGLRFEDKTYKKGESYIYRLTIADNPTPTAADTAIFIVDTKVIIPAPQVEWIRAVEGDRRVEIYWDRFNNARNFTAYHVERSLNEGKSFDRLTNHPLFVSGEKVPENIFIDSIPNGIPVHYRIIGLTPFGEEGTPSRDLMVTGRDLTPTLGATGLKAEGDLSRVKITWNLLQTLPDLRGFIVKRGHEVNGPFYPIHEGLLPVSAREFADTKPIALTANYYQVNAVDDNGNESRSETALAVLFDETPPAQPIGLKGSIDKTGKVSLTWEAVADIDCQGYRVYRANRAGDIYQQLTSKPELVTTFEDTVNMKALDEVVYYKIAAVDFNYNHSPYSEILALKRPDVIPPAAPVIHDYSAAKNGIRIDWYPSTSTDIVGQQVLRRKSGNTSWEPVASFDNNTQTFTDDKTEIGKTYEYKIQAKDDAGLITDSKALPVTALDDGERKGVTQLKGSLKKEDKTALLQWTYQSAGDDVRFLVYRAYEDAPLTQYKSLSADQTTLKDPLLKAGKWQYAVKVITADGGSSLMSDAIVVEY